MRRAIGASSVKWRVAVAFGCVAAAIGSSRAMAQPAAGGARQSALFATATAAPIDRIDGTFDRAGFPGVGDQLTQLIGGLGMVTPDQVDRAAPASIYYVIGENIDTENGAVIALPLKASAMTLAQLQQRGGKPVAGHADAVSLGGYTFRRTPAHLVFGALGDHVVEPSDDAIGQAATKDPNLLLRIDADFKTAKTVAPEAYAQMIAQMDQAEPADPNATGTDAARTAGEAAGRQAMIDFVRSLDTMSFALVTAPAGAGGDDERIALDVGVSPVSWAAEQAKATQFDRPAFPAGVVARFDSAYPKAKSGPLFTSFVQWAEHNGRAANLGTAPDPDMDEAFAAVVDLIVGDATSAAIAKGANDDFVVYGVIQNAQRGAGLAAKLDRIQKAVKAVDTKSNDPQSIKRTDRKQGALDVARLVLSAPQSQETVTIDLCERGNQILWTAAMNQLDVTAVKALADAKPAAGAAAGAGNKITSVMEIDADLPAIGQLVASSPEAAMNPQAKQLIAELCQSGHLRLTTRGEGKGLTTRLEMPLKAIGTAMKAMLTGEQHEMRPAAPAEPAPQGQND